MSADPAAPNSFLKRIGKALSISHANDSKKGSPPSALTAPRSTSEKVAISISINGRNGLSDELLFQDGDDPNTVARAFVAKHGLPSAAVPKLVSLIERQWQENVIDQNLLPPQSATTQDPTTPYREDMEPRPSPLSPSGANDGPRQHSPSASPDSGRDVLSEETPVDDSQQQQQQPTQQYASLLSQSRHFRSGGGVGSLDAPRAGGAVSYSGMSRRGEVSPASPSRVDDVTMDASFARPDRHGAQDMNRDDDGEANMYDNAKRQWESRPSGASSARGAGSSSRHSREGDFDAMPLSGRVSVSSMGSNRKQNLRGDGDSVASNVTGKQNTSCYDRLYREAEMRWARQERRRDAGISAVFEANFKTDFGRIPATQENLHRVYNVGINWQQRRDRYVEQKRRELQEREDRNVLQHCSFQPFTEKRLVTLSPERFRNDVRNRNSGRDEGGARRRTRSMSPTSASRGRALSFNAAGESGAPYETSSVVSGSTSSAPTSGSRKRASSVGASRGYSGSSIYGKSQVEIENRQKQVHQRLYEEKRFRELSHAKNLEKSEGVYDRKLFRPTIPHFSMVLALKKKRERHAAKMEQQSRVGPAEDTLYPDDSPSTPYVNNGSVTNDAGGSTTAGSASQGVQSAKQLKRVIKSELKTISPLFAEKKDDSAPSASQPNVDVFEELFNEANERRRRSSSAEAVRRRAMGIYEGAEKNFDPDRKICTADDFDAFYRRQAFFERCKEIELQNIERSVKREQFGAQKRLVVNSEQSEQFVNRMYAYDDRSKAKLEKLRNNELKKIALDTKKKFIDPKSESMLNELRANALSEIFDVLLWSVKFNVRMEESRRDGVDGATGVQEDDPLLQLSVPDESLDVSKSMPQILRPQDVANLVEAFFASLPKGVKLSRLEFVEKMNHLPGNVLSNLESSDNSIAALKATGRRYSNERRDSGGSGHGGKRLTDSGVHKIPTAMPLNMALFAPDVVRHNNHSAGSTPVSREAGDDDSSQPSRSSSVRGRSRDSASHHRRTGAPTETRSRGRSLSFDGAQSPSHRAAARSKSPSFVNTRSERLSLQGEQGERRRLGLSVFNGLHACDQVYRHKAAQSEQALWEERLKECTFKPKLYTRKPDRKKQARKQRHEQLGHQQGQHQEDGKEAETEESW